MLFVYSAWMIGMYCVFLWSFCAPNSKYIGLNRFMKLTNFKRYTISTHTEIGFKTRNITRICLCEIMNSIICTHIYFDAMHSMQKNVLIFMRRHWINKSQICILRTMTLYIYAMLIGLTYSISIESKRPSHSWKMHFNKYLCFFLPFFHDFWFNSKNIPSFRKTPE